MDDQQQSPQSAGNKTIYLVITVVVVVILAVIAATYYSESGSMLTSRKPEPTLAPSAVVTQVGSMTLTSAAPKTTVGSVYTITLKADTAQNPVVGFDALVSYDTSKFTFVSARSLTSGFLVSAKEREGVVAVTSTKQPALKTPTTFAKSDVVTLSFRATTKGAATFIILPQRGRETTKYVSEQTTVLTPSVTSLAAEVE